MRALARVKLFIWALVVFPMLAFAQPQGSKQHSAEWVQWALSIPASVNPMLDATGNSCMVGQHGSVWFLAGSFNGGVATRVCSIPEDTTLFLPVVNSFWIDTPGVCGQGASQSIKEWRAAAHDFIATAHGLSVELDGHAIHNLNHIRSTVFPVTFPTDSVFSAPCAESGGLPAGIYSPAVDEGYYVTIPPLVPGTHTLQIRAQAAGFQMDVTYTLHVKPVVDD
jgi:hypothetical protein